MQEGDNQQFDQAMSEIAAAAETLPLGRVAELMITAGQIVQNMDSKKFTADEFRFMTALMKGAADLAYPRPQK